MLPMRMNTTLTPVWPAYRETQRLKTLLVGLGRIGGGDGQRSVLQERPLLQAQVHGLGACNQDALHAAHARGLKDVNQTQHIRAVLVALGESEPSRGRDHVRDAGDVVLVYGLDDVQRVGDVYGGDVDALADLVLEQVRLSAGAMDAEDHVFARVQCVAGRVHPYEAHPANNQ